MPRGRYHATDDVDLNGHHLIDWRHLDDIPRGGADVGQVLLWNGSTWNPGTLASSGGDGAVAILWEDILNVPVTFPPSIHTHVLSDISDWPADHGALVGLADPDHPLSALQQDGAAANQAVVWSGSAWVPTAIVNSLVAGTGISVSSGTGAVTVSHNLVAGTSIDITGATISVKSALTNNIKKFAAEVVVNGGGSTVTTGTKAYLEIPMACTLTRACAVGDASGTVTFTIKKSTYSGFPGSLTDITGGTNFGLSSAQKNENTTLSGWTTSVASGDLLEIGITGTPATVTLAMLSLTFEGTIT